MKLTIARDEFIQGLARAHGVADRRSSMPVLANVLLETEGPGGLRISATDLHLGITGVAPGSIENGGGTTAAARTLFDIVRNLPAGDVNLSVDENQWLEVSSGRVNYRIAGIPAEDFPELPSAEDVDFFTLDAELLGSNELLFDAATTEVALEKLEGEDLDALLLLQVSFTDSSMTEAIGSRFDIDRQIALNRLAQAGAIVTTTEAAIMEMTGSSRHENFKQISSLIK